MKARLDIRLSPTDAKKLRVVARHGTRSHADAVRHLIAEAYEGIVRGETDAPATERR